MTGPHGPAPAHPSAPSHVPNSPRTPRPAVFPFYLDLSELAAAHWAAAGLAAAAAVQALLMVLRNG